MLETGSKTNAVGSVQPVLKYKHPPAWKHSCHIIKLKRAQRVTVDTHCGASSVQRFVIARSDRSMTSMEDPDRGRQIAV